MTKLLLLISFSVLAASTAKAQEERDSMTVEQKISELADKVTDLQNDQFKRSQLKFTGYIQAQFQVADSAGIASFAGGNFQTGTDKRFAIRRGRAKLDYQRLDDDGNIMTQGVVQVDYSQNGFALRDAYTNILDPHTKWIGFKLGCMDKPFGYEVTYSSSMRETPERGRMSQTLFPGEKDLGAQIYIMPDKISRFRFFRLEAGMYNGTGALAHDFDQFKDFISRINFFKNNQNETIKFSGDLSYYRGGYKSGTKFVDALKTDGNGNHYWVITDSSASNLNRRNKQEYYGADAQVSIEWAAGITTLRAEFITGTQSGTLNTSVTPTAAVTANSFTRRFNGAYFYWLQNIANSKHNIVVKYDWYDPNIDVKEREIGAVTGSSTLGAADIKYTTLGLGYYFNYDQNWRFIVYGDVVKNDPTKLSGYGSDLKDNVLTIRVLYKF